MKLENFLIKMLRIFNSVRIWDDKGGLEDEMYLYFQEEDGTFKFVFMGLPDPISYNSINKALKLPFVKDVGTTTFVDEGEGIIPRLHDMIIDLKEGIEDLEFTGCACDQCQCEDCENKEEKKWN